MEFRTRKDGRHYPLSAGVSLDNFMNLQKQDASRTTSLKVADTHRIETTPKFREPEAGSLRGDTLNSHIEASKTGSLLAPAMLSPKAERLHDRFPASGPDVKVLEKFESDQYNKYTIYEKKGHYYAWVDTPLGSRVYDFKKDKNYMLQKLASLKSKIHEKHVKKAASDLASMRQMANYIVTHSRKESEPVHRNLEVDLSKKLLSDDEFLALQSLYNKEKRKDDAADRILGSFITGEAIARGLLNVQTRSVPLL